MDHTKDFAAKLSSSTFGSGFFPVAPGTIGAAIAVAGLWFVELSTWMLSGCIVILFFLGVWASTRVEKIWGADPGRVNLDEVVGMMVSVLFLPKTLTMYAGAFLFFRIFDIAKPFPVNRAERLRAGWGIMMDDLIAGIYANLITQLFFRLIGPHV
ncbi:phosphatidylglycerophosphatase A [candidate division KSB1 bacterium]|nr:phosphatidylglycerophosphatase A [candidate division KSB1 bacterium]